MYTEIYIEDKTGTLKIKHPCRLARHEDESDLEFLNRALLALYHLEAEFKSECPGPFAGSVIWIVDRAPDYSCS